jgi:endoribonuclease Dicer
MVSNATLAAICIHLGLHHYLIYQSHGLKSQIEKYDTEIQKRRRFEDHQLSLGKKPTIGGYWIDTEPPKVVTWFRVSSNQLIDKQKVISDMLEAIIGAIYVSDGFNISGSENFYRNKLKPFYERYLDPQDLATHPMRRLTNAFETHGCSKFEFRKEKQHGGNMDAGQYVAEGSSVPDVEAHR